MKSQSVISSIGQDRLALVGPVIPLRGGIAHHTTKIHRHLRTSANVRTFSFFHLYPKWLYPGESQIADEFKNNEEPGVHYFQSATNPLSWLAVVREISHFRPSWIILPWWTIYWSGFAWLLTGPLRARGARVLFLCHNVHDHETATWKRFIASAVLRNADAFLTQNPNDLPELVKIQPKARRIFLPHPVYNDLPDATERLPRRASVELLYAGFVRQYKGVDVLLEALKLLPDLDWYLTLAGEWWITDPYLEQLIVDPALQPRLEVVRSYVSNQTLASFYQRADLVVLPYRKVSASGAFATAIRYNTPVIATNVGSLSHLVEDEVHGYLVPPGDPVAIADAIRRFARSDVETMNNAISLLSNDYSWESFTTQLLEFLK